jgi:hypothetical protein
MGRTRPLRASLNGDQPARRGMLTQRITGTIHLKNRVLTKVNPAEVTARNVARQEAHLAKQPHPWVRPEVVWSACWNYEGEFNQETIGGPSHTPLSGDGVMVIHDGGPGKCSLVVTETCNGPSILIRRNGRDDDHPEGFPEGHWYWNTMHLDFRRLLKKYVPDKDLRGAIGRFLFRGQSWEDAGLGGEWVRKYLQVARRPEEREDERHIHEAELVSWDTDVIETAFNDGQVYGEELEEREPRNNRGDA